MKSFAAADAGMALGLAMFGVVGVALVAVVRRTSEVGSWLGNVNYPFSYVIRESALELLGKETF